MKKCVESIVKVACGRAHNGWSEIKMRLKLFQLNSSVNPKNLVLKNVKISINNR